MNNPSEQHPSCKKCGLFQTCRNPFMQPTLPAVLPPKIIIVGEAPGEQEDRKNKPFIGPAGEKLRQALEGLGVDIDKEVMFTNVVRCRPPDNKITKRAIDYCKQFAMDEIKHYQPDMVWLMGNSPLQGILGESGITAWNGVTADKDIVIDPDDGGEGYTITQRFIPLYHPAYILRDDSHLGEWLEAMMNALDSKVDTSRYELVYPTTVPEVLQMAYWLRDCKEISYDVETSALDAFSADTLLLAVSFGGNGKAFSVPIDHPQSWWKRKNGNYKHPSDYDVVVQEIINILQEHSGHLIGHNIKFDLMHTYAQWELDLKAGGDTMLISHLLDSRKGIHGLKHLAAVHLGMYEYENKLSEYKREHREADPTRGGSYAFVPLEILLPYSAMDSEATLRLNEILYPKLSKKQKHLYKEMIIQASDMLTHIQCNGLAVDKAIANRYQYLYQRRRDDVYKQILADKHVKAITKERNQNAGKIKFKFNPQSPNQLCELYYDRYHLKPIERTATGNPSTSGGALKIYESRYPIVRNIRYYKLLNKMLSTYLTPCATGQWTCGDGRVRTTYNQHGTLTGRLSSSEPVNLQNIPTPEKEPGTLLETLPIKNIFTHSYWENGKQTGTLMSVDYSGMELRCFASAAKCQAMIDIHKSGKDFHSCIAIMSIDGRRPDEISKEEVKIFKVEQKAVRYRYKWTNWTLLYGGDAFVLHRMYDVPMDEAEETVERYYQLFPEVKWLQQQYKEFAETHGYIESPYGRREHLPYINDHDPKKRAADIRSAYNMPIQSGASDTLLFAAIIIDKRLRDGRYESKLVNTVHDSVVLDAPDDEVDEVARLCIDSMENVTVLGRDYFPKIDFSWLICPLKADVSIGSHYGTEEDWKPKN